MKNILNIFGLSLVLGLLLIQTSQTFAFEGSNAEQKEEEPEKGPHRGRLLKQDGLTLELSIFETGVPPEFRVWTTFNQQAVKPEDVSLTITLTRLGGITDNINFTAQSDFLRGDMVVYEPHSFVVTIKALYQGRAYHWSYDNFEGRTSIEPAVAEALEIGTSIATAEILKETISVYGKLTNNPESVRNISARFEGTIKTIDVSLGQVVKKGDPLFTIESNESLKPYTVYAPIDAIVQQRHANPDEQTAGRVLLSLLNNQILTAELAVFPSDQHKIKPGANVWLVLKGEDKPHAAVVKIIDSKLQNNQSVIVRAELNNDSGKLLSGTFVKAEIEIAEHQVALAVKRSGLQAFRDFTVVFAKVNNEYEVRMLELGRVAGEWVEVLGGLKSGTEYVSENSFIIKADIEKSGASHDH